MHTYIYISSCPSIYLSGGREDDLPVVLQGLAYWEFTKGGLRAIFVLRIFRLRIFESKFRNRCAKKLDVHEESPPSSFKNLFDSSSKFEDS